MEKSRSHVTERLLNLALEIIYLLTEEDCVMVKKAGKWVTPQFLINERNNEKQKILELTNKIIQLLTGEVPIRCQDVTVCFSMEEWEYIEGHQDLYKDVIENTHSDTTLGKNGNRKTPANHHTDLNDHVPKNTTNIIHSQESYSMKVAEINEMDSGDKEHLSGEEQQDKSPCTALSLERELNVPPGLQYVISTSVPKEDTTLQWKAESAAIEKEYLYSHKADMDKQLCPSEAIVDSDTYTHSLLIKESIHFKPELDSCEDCTKVERHSQTDPALNDHTFPIKTFHSKDTDSLKQTCLPKSDFTTRAQTQAERTDTEMEGSVRGLPDAKSEVTLTPALCNGEETCQCSVCEKGYNNNITQLNLHKMSHVEQKPFSCSECGERFSKTLDLVEHHRVHSEEKPFACPECGKQFANRANVIAHQMMHAKPSSYSELCIQKDEAPFFCSDCGMGFKSSSILAEHKKIHKQDNKFLCSICGKGFSKRGHLSNHNRIHTGGKRVSYSESGELIPQISHARKRPFFCLECGKCFPSRSHLDRHQRVHTGEKPFSCSECDKRFTDRSGLVIHQRIHTGEKPYSCNDCGKCFRDRSGLVVHQRNHTGQHPFRCLECGKCFHNRARLERHGRVHKEEKSFSCPACKQCFTTVSALTIHYRTHMEQTSVQAVESLSSSLYTERQPRHTEETYFPCSECGKSFTDSFVLSLHYRTHLVEQHQVQQRILDSGKLFKSPKCISHPLSHVVNKNIHTIEKPFPCSQCEKSFSDRTSILAHEQQHTGEKPYKCLECGECFVLKGYLTKHLETHA